MRSRSGRWALVLAVLAALSLPTAARAYEAGDYYAYLKSVYNRHDRDLDDYLLAELETFRAQFPRDGRVAETLLLTAGIQLERRQRLEAYATFMKILFLHAESGVRGQAADGAHKALAESGRFEDRLGELRAVIDGTFPDGPAADRRHAYSAFLHDLAEPRLLDRCLGEYREFLARHAGDPRAEQVQRWLAGAYAEDGRHEAATASYLKYEQLYPGSPHLPEVMLGRARVLTERTKEHEAARDLLDRIVADHPQSPAAAPALYERAVLKEKRLRDPAGAAADYRSFALGHPQHARAQDALLAAADLQAGKLQDYEAALATYDLLVTAYPGDERGVEALERSASLCARRLKDEARAADCYARIATLYPEHEKAPRALFEAADIRADKLADIAGAIHDLQVVGELYPGTEHARKAEERIRKLEAERRD